MVDAAASVKSIDEMRLLIIRNDIALLGVADCRAASGMSVAHALADAYVRADMAVLLIDFRLQLQDTSLPRWTARSATDQGSANAAPEPGKGRLVAMNADTGLASGFGNPAHMRTILMRERHGFDAVVCVTDALVAEHANATHLSILSACEGVVVRVVADVDTREDIGRAADHLKTAGCRLLGFVFDTSRADTAARGMHRLLNRLPAGFSRRLRSA